MFRMIIAWTNLDKSKKCLSWEIDPRGMIKQLDLILRIRYLCMIMCVCVTIFKEVMYCFRSSLSSSSYVNRTPLMRERLLRKLWSLFEINVKIEIRRYWWIEEESSSVSSYELTVAESTMSQQASSTLAKPIFRLSSRLSTCTSPWWL